MKMVCGRLVYAALTP
ncbi:hypothetical protein M2H08_21810 [Vibrio vulnificus]|nr:MULTISPECIES: hypothetical protein [Vibrio]MCU8155172.1 hypothetical protein [Vibrio vulnificus]MCU8361284.1 hypothetical protein [Vibrio vulnificus]MCU8470297.1 hypothetical protein [Vibrio vulnificus]MCU8483570.1 hypothetical protein [Vibrio vulnificus]MDK2679434.1 hypothetical protein [Vibrio vulnificus]